MNLKRLASYAFAVPVGFTLIAVLWHLNDTTAWLSTAFGLVAGWVCGFLVAPYQSEKQRFKEIRSLVGGFIVGFAFSKIETLWGLWTDPLHGMMILQRTFAHRALLFGTSFILAAMVTYVSREYGAAQMSGAVAEEGAPRAGAGQTGGDAIGAQ